MTNQETREIIQSKTVFDYRVSYNTTTYGQVTVRFSFELWLGLGPLRGQMSGMNVTSESTAEKRRCRSWNCVNCRRRRVEQSRARRVEVLESGHHQATNRTAIRADVDWVGCRKCSTFAPFAILAPLRKSPSPVLDPNPELRLISNPYPIPNSVINNRAVVVTYGSCYLSDITLSQLMLLRGLQSVIAKGRHSEEIRWGRLKMQDLMLKCNGILGLILQQNSTNHCKNFNQFTASCTGVLTRVYFPPFAIADPRWGGLIRLRKRA